MRERALRHPLVSLLLLEVGCLAAPISSSREPGTQFLIVACNQAFHVQFSDASQGARADSVVNGTLSGFVSGRLGHGDGGFNAPWHWHLKPESTYVVQAAVEVCDGCPETVEAGGFFQLGSYCPWSSRMVRREL